MELKKAESLEMKQKFTPKLLQNLEEYLSRCGLYEPYEKIYVKNISEFISVQMGRLLAIVLISQLSKLQMCFTTGK